MAASSSSSSSSRKGPSEPVLTQIGRNSVSIDKLEANNTGYNVSIVKANVGVSVGKYYFEVRVVTSGNIRIGWATEAYSGSDTVGNDSNSWGWDGSQKYKYSNGNGSSYGSDNWHQGDIIGCGIDLESGTIQYTHNGETLGTAFSGILAANTFYYPVASLPRKQKIVFNFGLEEFCCPLPGFHPLHLRVSEAEQKKFRNVFMKYSKMAGDGADTLSPPVIRGTGLETLGKDLGQKGDLDPLLLIVLWRLGCKQPQWEIPEPDFVGGFVNMGVCTMDAVKHKVVEWRKMLENPQHFGDFYNFVFDYLRGDAKTLSPDACLTAWQLLDMEKRWPLYPKWAEWFRANMKKHMSRDHWQQTLPFAKQYPSSVANYDPSASWPTLMDDFVEWAK